MKLIAHRGLRSKEFKENTLGAFQNAIVNQEISGFEFDVRQTKDKNFIINHNMFIKNDLIKSKRLKYLQNRHNITMLEDVLKLDTKKIFLVEIKDASLNYRKFCKLINKYSDKTIYIMSFHNKVINKLKKYHVKAKLGILNYVLNSEDDYEYDFICLLNNLTTDELINCYHNKNIEVFIYGVINEEKDLFFDNVYYILDEIPKSYLKKKDIAK